ncbi:HNH/ENDO VII family nuclease [Candidatus Bealeia paramacronuclearis]|uniref:HNH/ENDO VII family nuclease n=2 Tax=Candidatus Bealeia paramacronuclearis TaxID=1921001 RepID=A0ABZ2C8P4_9PROT|nr:HNH/ENDO VII family nuclease [Candidatus Bealeia paramacronuclearis]
MLVRSLVFFVTLSFFCKSDLFSVKEKNLTSLSPTKRKVDCAPDTCNSPKKNKINGPDKENENPNSNLTPSPEKKLIRENTVLLDTSLFGVQSYTTIEKSSEEKEKHLWDDIRQDIVKLSRGKKLDTRTLSDCVREIYTKHDFSDFFTEIKFQEKTVFQSDELFSHDALVLNKEGKWETNRDRMERGECPIGYAGVPKKVDELELKKALKTQKRYRIELQHVTQKDTGTDEDPICEMTHAAHMGKNARIIVRAKTLTGEIIVLHSSLEKEEAEKLLDPQDKKQVIYTNILHFRTGPSLINREDFKTFREGYWKFRIAELLKGKLEEGKLEEDVQSPIKTKVTLIKPEHIKKLVEKTN